MTHIWIKESVPTQELYTHKDKRHALNVGLYEKVKVYALFIGTDTIRPCYFNVFLYVYTLQFNG